MDSYFDLQIFTIVLRESLEAALIVGVIASVVSAQRQSLRPIILGVFAAVLASVCVAVILQKSSDFFENQMNYFDIVILIFSSVIMVQMVYWMKKNSRQLIQNTKKNILASESSRFQELTLFSTSFFVVFREGSETALYVLGRVIAFPQAQIVIFSSFVMAILALAAILAAAKQSTKILPLASFFRVTGWILLVTVAGYLITAADKLSAEGFFSFNDYQLLDFSIFFGKSTFSSNVIHFLTGLSMRPTRSEVVTFLSYWFFIFLIFGIKKFSLEKILQGAS